MSLIQERQRAPKNPVPIECDECGWGGPFELIQGRGPDGRFSNQENWWWECPRCGDTTSYLNFN